MAHTKSAKKRMRQNVKRRSQNRATKSMLRTLVKKVRQAVEVGDAAAAKSQLDVVAKRLDQAAAKGVIHKNAVARTKSRLAQHVAGIGTQKQAAGV